MAVVWLAILYSAVGSHIKKITILYKLFFLAVKYTLHALNIYIFILIQVKYG